jgi:hypothetical protein
LAELVNGSNVGFNIWYVRLPAGEVTNHLDWTSLTGDAVYKVLKELPGRIKDNRTTLTPLV